MEKRAEQIAQDLINEIQLKYLGAAYSRLIADHLQGNDTEYSDEYSKIVSRYHALIYRYSRPSDRKVDFCEQLFEIKEQLEFLFKKIERKKYYFERK